MGHRDIELGDLKTHRDGVSSDDGGNPAIGSGMDFTGVKTVRFYFDLGGTNPTWDATVLDGRDGSIYYSSEKRTITEDSFFDFDVNGSSDIYVKLDGSTGTTPTCTVKAQAIVNM